MQRLILARVWRGVLVLAMVMAGASAVSAQSIVDAGRVEFTPSADHNAVDPATSIPVVQSYSLQIFLAGGANPVQTVNLNKPTPQPDGLIRLDFLSLLTTPLSPGVIYESNVSAIGPGGSAASARSNTFMFSVPCTPSMSPTSQSVVAAGGTGTSTVTVASSCAWTAVSNVPWITVTAGASRTGTGTFSFSAAANTATTSRTGTLTAAGMTFTVTQAAAPCSFTLAPTSAGVVATASTGSVAVTAGTSCAWTATSNNSWITISSGASGSGNGSVSYAVAAHTGTASRTGTMTIAGQSFSVIQAGAPCSFTLSPTSLTIAASGGNSSVSVTSTSGCSWTATSGASWVTISSGASGNGSGNVAFTVAPNTTPGPRTATLTIGGKSFVVTQSTPAPTPPSNMRVIK